MKLHGRAKREMWAANDAAFNDDDGLVPDDEGNLVDKTTGRYPTDASGNSIITPSIGPAASPAAEVLQQAQVQSTAPATPPLLNATNPLTSAGNKLVADFSTQISTVKGLTNLIGEGVQAGTTLGQQIKGKKGGAAPAKSGGKTPTSPTKVAGLSAPMAIGGLVVVAVIVGVVGWQLGWFSSASGGTTTTTTAPVAK